MRVIAGRRSLGASGPPKLAAPQRDDYDDGPTTVSPMADIEALLASSDGDVLASADPPDLDADTYIDDRDVDVVLLAAGTGDLRPQPSPHNAAMVLVPRTSNSPPMGTGPFAYPGSYPISGPFGTVAPGHVETGPYVTTGPYPYVAPMPYGTLPPPSRGAGWRTVAISVSLVVAAMLGVVLGRFLVAGGAPVATSPQPAPAAPAAAPPPAAAPVASAAAASVPPDTTRSVPPGATASVPPVAAAAPDATAPISLEVASLEHPTIRDPIVSAKSGRVARAFLEGTRRLKKNEKLFEIVRRAPASARSKALAAKVKDLEAMAEEDPIYKEFLDKARRDYKRSQSASTVSFVVQAPRAGTYRAAVERGDEVDAQQTVASALDADVWLATATVPDDQRPGADWSCSVELESRRAACQVEQVEEGKRGRTVTVRVAARKAPWLSAGSAASLVLAPPAAAP